jgi:hypothetical protein
MSKSLKAAIHETHGIPAEVLRVVGGPGLNRLQMTWW